jgi:DNA-binding transcriptional MerR regulator
MACVYLSRMDPTKILFTRQQLGELVGADDSTLNFWSREELIRPELGGGGKGQHRRFRFEQVGLAALLLRFKRFGLNIQALREIASMFHEAIEMRRNQPLTDQERDTVITLARDRVRYLRDGYIERLVTKDTDWPGHTRHELIGNRFVNWVHLSWRDVVAEYKASNSGAYLTDHVLAFLEREDMERWSRNDSLYGLVGSIPDRLYEGSTPYYFYIDGQGDWSATADASNAAGETDSFIAIDTDRMLYSVWHGGAVG